MELDVPSSASDLLRTARGIVDADADPFPLKSVIKQILQDGGFAETHLHLGAAVDFSLVWAALMQALTRNEAKPLISSALVRFRRGSQSLRLGSACVRLRLVPAKWLFAPASTSSLNDIVNVGYGRGNKINSATRDPDEGNQRSVRGALGLML